MILIISIFTFFYIFYYSGNYCLNGTTSQNKCPSGNYCPTTSSPPLNCLPGNFCPISSISPSPCPLGFYYNKTIPAERVLDCQSCPVNRTTTSSGTAYLSSCECNKGSYINPITDDCVVCQIGLICDQVGLPLSNVTYKSDYFGESQSENGLLTILSCPKDGKKIF